MQHPPYDPILAYCERVLAAHGDTPAGMGWTDADAKARYDAILGVIRPSPSPCTLLDFGCGSAQLLDHLRARGRTDVAYRGLDLSEQALALCRRKHPGVDFDRVDVLAGDGDWPRADYIVMNGILTYKGSLSQAAMLDYAMQLLPVVFAHADVGLAFNVMSKQVDWERDDLFHLPMDTLADFLARHVSRHFVLRADYGLYEYTAYVYRDPLGMPATVSRLVGAGA